MYFFKEMASERKLLKIWDVTRSRKFIVKCNVSINEILSKGKIVCKHTYMLHTIFIFLQF